MVPTASNKTVAGSGIGVSKKASVLPKESVPQPVISPLSLIPK